MWSAHSENSKATVQLFFKPDFLANYVQVVSLEKPINQSINLVDIYIYIYMSLNICAFTRTHSGIVDAKISFEKQYIPRPFSGHSLCGNIQVTPCDRI